MSFKLEREFAAELIAGEKDTRSEIEDFKRSRFYFSELTDALMHYASPLPPEQFVSIAVRTNKDGVPQVESVTETRFPPLDDLPDHLKKLRYSARQLDKLSPVLWQELWDSKLTGVEDAPYIPMSVALCGQNNNQQITFRRDAWIYKNLLGDLSWSHSENPDSYRDMAEQCFRIVDVYIQLSEFFAVKGLPNGVEDF